MTLYVKGFKIDRQKIADAVGTKVRVDPVVEAAIDFIVHRLNRSAYLNIELGHDLPGPEGERRLALIIALATGKDEDELKNRDLGEIDESILEALPYVLVGPDVWKVWVSDWDSDN